MSQPHNLGSRHCSFAPIEELIRLYTVERWSSDAIARHFNVTKQGVLWHLKKSGVAIRPNATPVWMHTPEALARQKERAPRGVDNCNYRELPMDKISELYESGLSTLAIGEAFGVADITISRKLASSGIERRQRGFSRYRAARDEHRVQSAWEMLVDDWMLDHDIPHAVQPLLPFGHSQRADFFACGRYIEIWGVTHNAAYGRRRLEKITNYAAHNLDLIEVFPHHIVREDFRPLHVLL